MVGGELFREAVPASAGKTEQQVVYLLLQLNDLLAVDRLEVEVARTACWWEEVGGRKEE